MKLSHSLPSLSIFRVNLRWWVSILFYHQPKLCAQRFSLGEGLGELISCRKFGQLTSPIPALVPIFRSAKRWQWLPLLRVSSPHVCKLKHSHDDDVEKWLCLRVQALGFSSMLNSAWGGVLVLKHTCMAWFMLSLFSVVKFIKNHLQSTSLREHAIFRKCQIIQALHWELCTLCDCLIV